MNQTRASELLHEWREKVGLSQTAAAEKLAMSQAAYSGYESGTMEPSIGKAISIESGTDGAVPLAAWGHRPKKRRNSKTAA